MMISVASIGLATYVGMQMTINGVNGMNKAAGIRNYAMYAAFCSDVATVRKYLDQGPLAKMLAEKEEKMLLDVKEPGMCRVGPGYDFILLGACAMSLGATIPENFKASMRKVYVCVGLMETAVLQIDKALKGYKDGVPWEFRSLDLHEQMKLNLKKGKVNDGGVIPCNTPGPGTMFYNPPKGPTEGLDQLKLNFVENRYGSEACGQCGIEEGNDGSTLRECGRCHSRKYCSTDCQKAHWMAAHKKFCKKALKEKKENIKPDPATQGPTTEEAVLNRLMKATMEDVD